MIGSGSKPAATFSKYKRVAGMDCPNLIRYNIPDLIESACLIISQSEFHEELMIVENRDSTVGLVSGRIVLRFWEHHFAC
jgi:hypothetical protein